MKQQGNEHILETRAIKEEIKKFGKDSEIDLSDSVSSINSNYRRQVDWSEKSIEKLGALGMIVCRHCSNTASVEDNYCHICGNIFRVNLMSGF